MNKKKLNFQLVPDGCWYSNLRAVLTKSEWEYIRKYVISRADGKCEICGKSAKSLHAHEVWEYQERDNKTGVQKLKDVIAVCPLCHSVIHIGYTSLKGDLKKAEEQYMKVNGCSYSDMRKDLGNANEKHRKLNEISEWKTDLTWLKIFENLK